MLCGKNHRITGPGIVRIIIMGLCRNNIASGRRHLAILKRHYLDLILSGQKSVECRLTRVACAPFGRIAPGERVLLKQSSGPVRGQAVVEKILFFDDLTPRAVQKIRRGYNNLIQALPEYWESRQDCQYCTLVWLSEVRRVEPYRFPKKGMQAWVILEDQDPR